MTVSRWRAASLVVGLAVTAAALGLAGRALATPPVRSWAAASRWYELVGPAVAFVAVLRLAALGVAAWLLVATVLQLVATVAPGGLTRSVADLVAPRSLQRLVQGLAGLSLTAGLAAAAPGAALLGEPSDGVAIVRLIEGPPSDAGTATMHLLPDPSTGATLAASPGALDVVAVEPGDSLWSIARDALIDGGTPAPTDGAIDHYWRRLIHANRSALVDPANPDLIYPGQVFTLPAP